MIEDLGSEAVSAPPIAADWQEQAEAIIARVVEGAEPTIKRWSEALYEHVLRDVQDHLLNNATFNLKSSLDAAQRSVAESRARIAELERESGARLIALIRIIGATHSHVDGRDLLTELHPRRQLDIKQRVDGVETWFEGDWLSGLWGAVKEAKVLLGIPPIGPAAEAPAPLASDGDASNSGEADGGQPNQKDPQ